MEKLAAAMTVLGWTASVVGGFLKVEENRALTSPEWRGARYVWDGAWAAKPETMAKKLDAFLREIGKAPAAR